MKMMVAHCWGVSREGDGASFSLSGHFTSEGSNHTPFYASVRAFLLEASVDEPNFDVA